MANIDALAYNVAVFVSTLFLLEFGADKFIDHTAIVAKRTGISETLIGLLTAGGEWEELAVVVASLARGRSSLAISNIIGSAIANILGAFSLGLLFHDSGSPIQFDRSSRIYSLLLLILTTFVTPITYFSTYLVWLVCGSILIVWFVLYIGSVGWLISNGSLTAPEGSDDGSSEDSDSSDGGSSTEDFENTHETAESPLLGRQPTRHKRHSLRYHIAYLILGFLAICLSGYVLSHAATTITDELNMSDVLFGVVILSTATTLPEKFIAVVSGHRGHAGILVANTAGSNIFLLSLCIGIVMLDTSGNFENGNVKIAELGFLWGSTVLFTLTVWLGGRFSRWIGAAMLIAYVAFILIEFTVVHNVSGGD